MEEEMKAVDELRNEHKAIERMLRILQAMAEKIRNNEQIVNEQLDGIMEFLSVFVDDCHHGKEEEFLFPALEAAGVQRESGPIGDLLGEHEQGRGLVERLKKSLETYRSGNMESSVDVHIIINEYVGLMIQHIEKENKGLFLMAEDRLDASKDNEIIEAFDKIERERIGSGKHDEFHAFLDDMNSKYLK
jgi:hemerythrin-like domain-containing protein